MRIVFVKLAILCLALAPCVPARSLTSTESSLVDTRFSEDETPAMLLHVEEVNRYPSSPGSSLERRSLKKSSGSKSSKHRHKSKSFRWGGKPVSLWAAVVAVGIVVSIFLLCWAFVFVTEKREKDPKWHVRTFFRRKLKHQYTIKGMKARRKKSAKLDHNPFDEEDEKPEKLDLEKTLVPAADAVSDPLKTPAT